MSGQYQVSTSTVSARPLLAVRARLTFEELPTQIPALLKRVYDSAEGQDLLDGQNVVVYRGDPPGFDVEIGVGLKGRPEPSEGLVLTATPAGEAAHTTHWGEYSELHRAHQAIIAWCVANERALAGVNWEVYGHWSAERSQLRTDVYYLLGSDRRE